MAESATIETRTEAEKVGGEAKYWQQQIELSEQDHKDFLKDGETVVKRYKGSREKAGRSDNKKFNILYSNTETLKAALFARMAKPDIRRRFADRDPVGKQVAEIVERAAIYCQDAYDSEKAVERAIEDYLLPARGIVRVCYEAETAKGDDGKEYVAKQELYEQYVNWIDFRHEPAKTWDKVTWEAFRHRMSRDDLKDNKFANPELIPLNWSPSPDSEKVPDAFKRAEVWEIFDKTSRKRYWIVPGYKDLLRTDEDPYGLEDFFPNAEPLQAITTNDTVIPRPEFHIYRDQADGLDEIEARIDRLTRALKRRGVYDATFKELARLSKAADNEFVPVKNYAELSTKGGLAAAFQAEDLTALATVLGELHQQRDLRVQTIYEVVGIADIMRGSSDPRETLGAQKIKAQFGGNRLKKRQDKVQKWIRDTLRIKAEIIAEHFEPQKLAEMTGFKWMDEAALAQQQQQMMQQAMASMPPPQPGQPPAQPPQLPPPSVEGTITPDMIKVLRSDKLRSYRIDIETDSTVFEDAEAEKQAVTEMLKAASEFVTAWMPVIQAQPAMLDMAFEMLSFALRRFKTGRSLEEVIEQTKMKLTEAAKQPRPPSPEVQVEQAKAAAIQQKAQIDGQAQQAKAQIEQQRAEADLVASREKHAAEMEKMRADAALAERKAQLEEQHAVREHALRMTEMTADQGRAKELHQQKMTQQSAKQSEGPSAQIQVKHGADEITGPIGDAIAKFGEHISAGQAQHAEMIGGAIKAMTAPRRKVPKRGPDGKILHVDEMMIQ